MLLLMSHVANMGHENFCIRKQARLTSAGVVDGGWGKIQAESHFFAPSQTTCAAGVGHRYNRIFIETMLKFFIYISVDVVI